MKITFIVLCLLVLTSCLPNTYKRDVPQGNVLTQKQIAQVKVGMSTDEVKDILGSPSVIDTFHNNRWDYINNSFLHSENRTMRVHLILLFNKQGALTKIDKKNINQVEK